MGGNRLSLRPSWPKMQGWDEFYIQSPIGIEDPPPAPALNFFHGELRARRFGGVGPQGRRKGQMPNFSEVTGFVSQVTGFVTPYIINAGESRPQMNDSRARNFEATGLTFFLNGDTVCHIGDTFCHPDKVRQAGEPTKHSKYTKCEQEKTEGTEICPARTGNQNCTNLHQFLHFHFSDPLQINDLRSEIAPPWGSLRVCNRQTRELVKGPFGKPGQRMAQTCAASHFGFRLFSATAGSRTVGHGRSW